MITAHLPQLILFLLGTIALAVISRKSLLRVRSHGFYRSPSGLDAGLALLCTFFLIATARIEERENVDYFGDEYVEYIARSKMFVPFVF